jgi:hypothetical protein
MLLNTHVQNSESLMYRQLLINVAFSNTIFWLALRYPMNPMQDNISFFSTSSTCILISMHITLPCFLCSSFLPTYIYFCTPAHGACDITLWHVTPILESTPFDVIESLAIWETLWRPKSLQNLTKQSHGSVLVKMFATWSWLLM